MSGERNRSRKQETVAWQSFFFLRNRLCYPAYDR